MIPREELRAEVCRLIFGQPVPDSDLSDDDDLYAAGLDSMAVLKLVAWIEKRIGRDLPHDAARAEHFKSLRALAAMASAADQGAAR